MRCRFDDGTCISYMNKESLLFCTNQQVHVGVVGLCDRIICYGSEHWSAFTVCGLFITEVTASTAGCRRSTWFVKSAVCAIALANCVDRLSIIITAPSGYTVRLHSHIWIVLRILRSSCRGGWRFDIPAYPLGKILRLTRIGRAIPALLSLQGT